MPLPRPQASTEPIPPVPPGNGRAILPPIHSTISGGIRASAPNLLCKSFGATLSISQEKRALHLATYPLAFIGKTPHQTCIRPYVLGNALVDLLPGLYRIRSASARPNISSRDGKQPVVLSRSRIVHPGSTTASPRIHWKPAWVLRVPHIIAFAERNKSRFGGIRIARRDEVEAGSRTRREEMQGSWPFLLKRTRKVQHHLCSRVLHRCWLVTRPQLIGVTHTPLPRPQPPSRRRPFSSESYDTLPAQYTQHADPK
jgi:hypothetical protein